VGAILGPVIAAVANVLFRVFFPRKAAKQKLESSIPDVSETDEKSEKNKS
jgi:predicted PurR-regulated permease PerM